MPEPRNVPLAREPRMPHRAHLEAAEARILDPERGPVVDGVKDRPTAYVGTRLMIAKGDRLDDHVALLQSAAESLGWQIRLETEPAKARRLPLGVRTVRISGPSTPVMQPPDAWALLQTARALHGRRAMSGVDL